MTWTVLSFSKHAGKTLPMIVFDDPDWFFWAIETEVFSFGRLADEAVELDRMARAIVIPKSRRRRQAVEYVIDDDSQKVTRVYVVDADEQTYVGRDSATRRGYFDLSLPRRICPYDKRGGHLVVRAIKRSYFGDESRRMNRARCERFFDEREDSI